MSRVRDHWSIGEVLSLLQDEFPEVTISKIRFLESQGLIDPERTPSGYRKFSDSDYDRLYWILEQQRDHYLPLRVIRDRLDEGQEIAPAPRRGDARIGDEIDDDETEGEDMFDDETEGEVPPAPPQPPEGYAADMGAEVGAEQTFAEAMAGREGPVVATDPTERHPVRDADANALADLMAGQMEPASRPADSPEPADIEEAPVAKETPEVEPELSPQSGDVPAEADPAEPDPASPSGEATIGRGEEPARRPAPRLLGTRTEPPRPVTKSPSEALAPPPRPSLPGSSVALTRDELAEQSGSTPGMVAELEKHGLISPRRVGSAILFDSTALTITRLAVQFGRYGLEPRHLRTFRLGAEREVALLTQSIGPTLKAHNPETRRRSFDTLQDLAELAASLRSIIVRDLVADLEPG